jgi:hypothetical protein
MANITKKSSNEVADAIDGFLKELPNPITSMQSFFLKEMSVGNKKVTLLAQKFKGSKGMTWDVNISKYHN